MEPNEARRLLFDLFQSAVKAATASRCIPDALPPPPTTPACVIGAGKAAAAMARSVEQSWPDKAYGVALTRYGHGAECQSVEVVEASHPVPDAAGLAAARRIRDTVKPLDASGFVVFLISGGASALLTLPHPGIEFSDKRSITRQLLASGASISELNCVRKHLSAIKGGRLMADIHPARCLTLCISDVAGDDPSIIGSGPTVADQSTCRDALHVIDSYRIHCPDYIRRLLTAGELETPKRDSPVFLNSEVIVVARPMDAFQASIDRATRLGLTTHFLGDDIEGDTNAVAREHAQAVRHFIDQGHGTPFVLLSGGETTVRITGNGKGGPNTQFALALALELNGMDGVYALACDTDGIDGSEDNAGAWVDPGTLVRAMSKNMDASKYLNNNDSYGFFNKLDDIVTTGPTLTNVNDFRAIFFTGS